MRAHAAVVAVRLTVAVLLVACDGQRMLEPPVPPAARLAAGGPQLSAPSNTKAVAVSVSQIDVSWQDNSSNETRFEVQRSTGASSSTITTAANVVAIHDSGLQSGTTYCYDVRAVRIVGSNTTYSAFSTSACATTLVPPPPPPPPPPPSPPAPAADARAKPLTSSTVRITWSFLDTLATSVRIDRSTDGGATWVQVGSEGRLIAFDDYPVPSERTLCYRVVARNVGGEAAPSNTTCTAAPAAPSLTAFPVDSATIDLSWRDNSSVEDGYQVWLYAWRGTYGCYPPGSGATDAGNYEAAWPMATLPPNATTYRAALLPPDTICDPPTSYSFFVVAMRDGGTSDWSDQVPATGGSLASNASAGRLDAMRRVIPRAGSTPR